MKKWKKQFTAVMLIGYCFVSAPLMGRVNYSASDYYNPCPNFCCDGNYGFYADFLWWKPCVDRLDFAQCLDLSSIHKNGPIKVNFRTLCPDWEPGIRLQGVVSDLNCGGMGLTASWTYIHPKESVTAHGKSLHMGSGYQIKGSDGFADIKSDSGDSECLLFSPFSFLGLRSYEKIHASWEVSYHDWDILLFYPCCVCGNSQIWTPYFGLAGLVLDQEMKAINKGDLEIAHLFTLGDFKWRWKSDLSAYGLRVGMKYEWTFCEGFKIYGKADASVLAGDPCNKETRSLAIDEGYMSKGLDDFDINSRFKDDKCYRCYPGYRLAAGVSYDTCICNMDVSARIGYEFVEWHNVPNHRQFFETVNPVITFDAGPSVASAALAKNGDIDVGFSVPSLNSTSPSDRTLGFNGLE